MSTERQYWVRWNGSMVQAEGQCSPQDPSVRAFLRALGVQFAKHAELTQTAVVAPGDDRIALSAVVSAADDGAAVNLARASFEDAIRHAGGESELPNGNHQSWTTKQIQEFVHLLHAEVTELSIAA